MFFIPKVRMIYIRAKRFQKIFQKCLITMTLTLIVGLIKHVGRIGINGLSYGKYNRHDCKAICQLDRKCKGFSLVDGVTKDECFTHTQIDHTTSISDFYEFPTECLV